MSKPWQGWNPRQRLGFATASLIVVFGLLAVKLVLPAGLADWTVTILLIVTAAASFYVSVSASMAHDRREAAGEDD